MKGQSRDPEPIPFNHIYQIISGGIRLANGNIRVAELVFAQNSLDLLLVEICEWDGISDCDTTFILLADSDVWRFLVESDSKTFQLAFNDFLVSQGFEYVQYNEDEVACSGDYPGSILECIVPRAERSCTHQQLLVDTIRGVLYRIGQGPYLAVLFLDRRSHPR